VHRGYIRLWRKFFEENKFWTRKRVFSHAEAWIDILQMTCYNGTKTGWGDKYFSVERGSFVTSERFLSERWQWSTTKVRSYIQFLISEKMLIRKCSAEYSTLTVVNYELYNQIESSGESAEKAQKKRRKSKEEEGKESKEVKKIYLERVFLSENEYDRLVTEFGRDVTDQYIFSLDEYIGMTGKKYKDHNLTIRKWMRTEAEKNPKPESSKPTYLK
jgi:hypothetical protein